MLRVLAADGTVADPSIPVPELGLGVALLADLERARLFDRVMLRQARRGRIKGYYPSAGQEGLAALAPVVAGSDMVFPAYREQPLRLAMGITVGEEVAMWAGAPRAAWDPTVRRMMPANTAIGSHLPHAVGWAMAQQRLGSTAVAWAVFGDGATSEGDFHAAANLAGVESAPVVFVCQNNQYAQTTPLSRQTGSATIADKASAYGIAAERVDGMDVFAIHDAAQRAARRARDGGGPTLIELVMYRFSGHSSFEVAPTYRSRGEEAEWKSLDPIVRLRRYLASGGLDVDDITSSATASVSEEVDAAIDAVAEMSIPTPGELAQWVGIPEPQPSLPLDTRPASVVGSDPSTVAGALNATLHTQMALDPSVVVFGQDIADGGIWTVTTGLRDAFGTGRVIDAPLNEVAIVGAAIGMALAGLRPVVEIQFGGFVLTAIDQLTFHAARYAWRTQGALRVPLVVRMPSGGGHGGYEGHNDSFEGLLAQVPGLVVVAPSNPRDAHGLLATAIRSDAPVIVLEPTAEYGAQGDAGNDAEGESLSDLSTDAVPIGRARRLVGGDAVTVITYGSAVRMVRAALTSGPADVVQGVDLLDLRSIAPWDREAVLESVGRTGRCVIVHDSPRTAGFGAELAATISEHRLSTLRHPVMRVAQPDLPYGPALMEPTTALTAEAVLDALREVRQDMRSTMTDIP